MSSSFDARALLEDLPELLAGARPVLETARARARLVEDPEMRAALLLAGSVAAALKRGATELAIDPTEVPHRLRRSAEVASRSFGRGLASLVFDVGLHCLDQVLTETGSAITWAGPVRGPMPPSFDAAKVSRSVGETRELLGVSAGRVVDSFLAALKHPSDPRALLRQAMDVCDSLVPGMDEPRHTRMLADPRLDADPQCWLEVSRRCSTLWHVGASLQEVGLAHVKRGDYAGAVLANVGAREYLGPNVGLACDGLLAGLLASDAAATRDWAMTLAKILSHSGPVGESADSVGRRILVGRSGWSEVARKSSSLLRAVERDLPADVVAALTKVIS